MKHVHDMVHAVVKVPEWSSMDKGDYINIEQVFSDYWKALKYRDALIKTEIEHGVHSRYGIRNLEVFN